MQNFYTGFEKRAASYIKDFLGGVDPTGTITVRSAKQQAVDKSKNQGLHRAVAAAGGIAGGIGVLAPAVGGTVGGVSSALSTPGNWRTKLMAAGKGFVSGAKKPFLDVYHGVAGGRKIMRGETRDVGKHVDYLKRSTVPKEFMPHVKMLEKELPMYRQEASLQLDNIKKMHAQGKQNDPLYREAVKRFESRYGSIEDVSRNLQSAGKSALTPAREAAEKAIGRKLYTTGIGGASGLGLSGAIGGGSAYLQYGVGRASGERERKLNMRINRIKQNRMKREMRKKV